ncbi:MAG: DUF898 domain-containing protein [Moraxellaceae bacterium]|nr:MAG: DUF898 domain-containing protein [Moraxellaceae bacterium]
MSQYPASPDAEGGREIHFPQVPDPASPPAIASPSVAQAPIAPPPFSPVDDMPPPSGFMPQQRFSFHGNGSEYFGIWIVNLVLTIITIGFYAPWAKVRRLRYFYGHTRLADRAFDFTGIPTKILAGRMIAAAVYFIYAFAGQYSPKMAIAGFMLLFLVLPWLLRATFRFNARNSKYSNSRLFFSGSTAQIYKTLLLCLLIMVFTLGIMTPYAIWLYKRYQFNHLHLGQLDFKLDVDVGRYFSAIYVPYFMLLGIMVVGGLLVGLTGMNFSGGFSAATIAFIAGIYVMMLLIVPLIQARLYKATWNHVSLASNRFACDINQWRYSWIVVSNWLAKIVSFGLLSAWAAVRIYRYKIESLSVHLINSPNDLLTMALQDPSAFAEELTDILDIDVSL